MKFVNSTTTTQLKQFNTSKLLKQSAAGTQPLFHIEDRKDKGYVILKLNRPPVNSLSLEFLTELSIQLEKIEQNKDINGVILTSNSPHIFSAGLDILEMYQCKRERAAQFWNALQEFWIKLYGSSKIYIAAINVWVFFVLLRFEFSLLYRNYCYIIGTFSGWWLFDGYFVWLPYHVFWALQDWT